MEASNPGYNQPQIPPASSNIHEFGQNSPDNPAESFTKIDELFDYFDDIYDSVEAQNSVVIHIYSERVPGEFRMNIFRKVGEGYMISQVHSAHLLEDGMQSTHIVFDQSSGEPQILLARQNIQGEENSLRKSASVTNILTKDIEVEGEQISKEHMAEVLVQAGVAITRDPNAHWELIEDMQTLDAIKSMFPTSGSWEDVYETSINPLDGPIDLGGK